MFGWYRYDIRFALPVYDDKTGKIARHNIYSASMLVRHADNGEIIQRGIEDFREVQDYMTLACKENTTETYAKLKEKYISLKALLNSLGINMADIDRIKE